MFAALCAKITPMGVATGIASYHIARSGLQQHIYGLENAYFKQMEASLQAFKEYKQREIPTQIVRFLDPSRKEEKDPPMVLQVYTRAYPDHQYHPAKVSMDVNLPLPFWVSRSRAQKYLEDRLETMMGPIYPDKMVKQTTKKVEIGLFSSDPHYSVGYEHPGEGTVVTQRRTFYDRKSWMVSEVKLDEEVHRYREWIHIHWTPKGLRMTANTSAHSKHATLSTHVPQPLNNYK